MWAGERLLRNPAGINEAVLLACMHASLHTRRILLGGKWNNVHLSSQHPRAPAVFILMRLSVRRAAVPQVNHLNKFGERQNSPKKSFL